MFYNYGGLGGSIIAKTLNIQVVFPYKNQPRNEDHKNFALMQPTPEDQIEAKRKYARPINWGVSKEELLPPNAVNLAAGFAVSKINTYKMLTVAGVNCPKLIDPKQIAAGYPGRFLGRKDRECEGRGIRRYGPRQKPVVQHDFYVPLLPNCNEYRVHVVFGEVVAVSHKVVPEDYVRVARNHRFGCRQEPVALDEARHDVMDLAIDAVAAMNLDFAAVDIMESNDGLYVLELNTAPGFGRSSTVIAYCKAFRKNLALPGEQELKLHTLWLTEFFAANKGEENGND